MSNNGMLQEYFDFTESELEENRQGRVTEEQALIIKERTQKYNNLAVAITLLLLAVVVGIILNSTSDVKDFPIMETMSIPLMIAGGVVIFLVLRTVSKNDFSVQKVEGKVNFVWVEERTRGSWKTGDATVSRFKMRVGGKSFDVREELMDIIDSGERYRFFYTSGGDILSAEVLEKT